MKKQPYIFYLSEDMHTDLKAAAEEQGVSMSALITEAFAAWIESRHNADAERWMRR